jgi:hypothetical protein
MGLVLYFFGVFVIKNRVYIAVVVVSVALAGFIFHLTHSTSPGSIESLKRGELIWVKCNNPDCGEAYQIDKKDYFLQIEERIGINTMSLHAPPLV